MHDQTKKTYTDNSVTSVFDLAPINLLKFSSKAQIFNMYEILQQRVDLSDLIECNMEVRGQ